MNLTEIKQNIIRFVESGENVDKVIDIVTSNLDEDQKLRLVELFEEEMINQLGEADTVLTAQIKGSLKTILNSRLFVYPEPETTYQQDLYNEKLDEGSYTAEDFHEQIFHHSKSPLSLKIKKWEDATNSEFGGLVAIQSDSVQKRNQMIYRFSDKLAKNINKNNIDVGIYISDLDKQIVDCSAGCDILSVMHLHEIVDSKTIMIWDAITSAKNLQPPTEEGFGTYRIICKLQWDFLNKSIDPCAGSVQIDKCENLSVIKRKYFPIFMESFDDINDLETNIKLLYNKLHELREDPKISC
tara:strand:- start:482 stop:1375 length:894 start_codon:yes stop_codon:yes gene_type:complete